MLHLSPLLGDELQVLFESAARLLRDHSSKGAIGSVRQLWDELAKLTWLSVCLSDTTHPRSTPNVKIACTLAEAFGYAGVQAPFVAAVLSAWAIAEAEDADRAAELLAAQVEGRTLIVPVLPLSPGDGMPAVTFRHRSTGCELNGQAILVEHATVADQLLVVALAEANPNSIAYFIVPVTARGVTITPMPTSGGEHFCKIQLTAVETDTPLIDGGSAARLLSRLDRYGAALRAAELAGIGRAALELTLDYARQREQFGRPIGSFQAVHHHVADMVRDLTATRLLVAQAAYRLDQDGEAGREASLAKAKASEAIPALLRLAHQITGGVGFYSDYPLEGYYRRAIDAAASFGNALEHRRRLANLLRSDPATFRGPNAHVLPPARAERREE